MVKDGAGDNSESGGSTESMVFGIRDFSLIDATASISSLMTLTPLFIQGALRGFWIRMFFT